MYVFFNSFLHCHGKWLKFTQIYRDIIWTNTTVCISFNKTEGEKNNYKSENMLLSLISPRRCFLAIHYRRLRLVSTSQHNSLQRVGKSIVSSLINKKQFFVQLQNNLNLTKKRVFLSLHPSYFMM